MAFHGTRLTLLVYLSKFKKIFVSYIVITANCLIFLFHIFV
ncbi:hypothetical protein IB211_02932 [Intestinimonas butyriciproducens]|uniref:Uncharacterized protein n=1 Tax=Intestinimonas butyriciproducens TaxID=1297617 RepID=A0A0S2W7L7_9FIRM|nr:hypothetical protein IB211_02932 [Intestinimonas butyriciproducens]